MIRYDVCGRQLRLAPETAAAWRAGDEQTRAEVEADARIIAETHKRRFDIVDEGGGLLLPIEPQTAN